MQAQNEIYEAEVNYLDDDEIGAEDVSIVPLCRTSSHEIVRHKNDRTWLVLEAFIAIIAFFPIMTSFDFGPWTIPVTFQVLPPQLLTTTVHLDKTGQRIIPAASATGTLSISNGSILVQRLPAGFIVISSSGVEIVTDAAVTIPASDGVTFGVARVQAHAVVAGQAGNIAPLAINSVIESSLFVRNKEAFTGGEDASTVQYATKADRDSALSLAQEQLKQRVGGRLTNGKCVETADFGESSLMLRWACRFLSYRVPDGAHVLSARRDGTHILLEIAR